LYAGGIWNFSAEAMALAADQLVRKADGFWMYTEGWSAQRHESISKWHAAVAQWSEEHPAGVRSDLSVDAMAAARQWVEEHKPDGITASEGGIVTRYLGEAGEVALSAAGFESGVAEAWLGRGKLPPVDKSVAHSGEASIRFEPSAERASPNSPYLDQKVPDVQKGQAYELFFWARTAASGNPTRLWVGAAGSDQWPGYMWYHNYMLPSGCEWLRLRTPISNSGKPPLVLRFWCPPTDGKMWLDDVSLISFVCHGH
jgi:hypothetical protein